MRQASLGCYLLNWRRDNERAVKLQPFDKGVPVLRDADPKENNEPFNHLPLALDRVSCGKTS